MTMPPYTDYPVKFTKHILKLAKRYRRKARIVLLWVNQDGKCHYCQREMDLHYKQAETRAYATLDHIVPHVRGGKRDATNVVAACKRCNTMKGAMSYEEFMVMRQQHMKGERAWMGIKERRRQANNPITRMQAEMDWVLAMQLPTWPALSLMPHAQSAPAQAIVEAHSTQADVMSAVDSTKYTYTEYLRDYGDDLPPMIIGIRKE